MSEDREFKFAEDYDGGSIKFVDMDDPEKFMSAGSEIIRGEYVNRGVLRWLFSKRRQILPNKVIIFSPVNLATKGMAILDPIHNIWQKPVEFLQKRPSPHYMGDEDHWLCEQYRELPSRWESMLVKIAWFFESLLGLYWLRSDKSVISSMRKSGRIK